MRILEVNVDDIGAGGVYALVRNIISLKPHDLEIDIACIALFENVKNVKELNEKGSKVYYVGAKNKFIRPMAYILKLSKLIKKNGYSCVHIHSDVAYMLLLFLIGAKLGGCNKIFLHSHAAGIDGKNRNIKYILHKICRRYLVQSGVKCLACSDVAAEWMFPGEKDIIIIKNGINVEKYKYNYEIRKEVREQLGVAVNELVIGHIGRFAYQKNHEYLLKIFQQVKKKNNRAKLLLVGEGPLYGKIRRKVHELGLEDVIFFGVTDRANEILQAMDVFVLPSFFEGFPIVGVEAQAAGLPCFFSDYITKEVKLISEVSFLPIDEEHVSDWANAIVSLKSYTRLNESVSLIEKGYHIKNTVNVLTDLYLN